MSFSLISISKTEHPNFCQHCGHEIWNLYLLESDNRETIIVGSECAEHLCGVSLGKMKTRFERAARQWLKNNPSRLKDESRAQYIERRVNEMINAKRAAEEWIIIYRSWEWHYKRVEERWRRLVKAEKIWVKGKSFGWHEWTHNLNYTKFRNHVVKKIARRFKANPFDFMKPIWEVNRI